GFEANIQTIALQPQGRQLALGLENGTLLVRHIDSDVAVARLSGPNSPWSVSVSPPTDSTWLPDISTARSTSGNRTPAAPGPCYARKNWTVPREAVLSWDLRSRWLLLRTVNRWLLAPRTTLSFACGA